MGIESVLDFLVSFVLGLLLIMFSHGKIPGATRLSLKFSSGFLNVIRYIGWFTLLYSCYGLWLDSVLRNL
jgi:hypothetical protein